MNEVSDRPTTLNITFEAGPSKTHYIITVDAIMGGLELREQLGRLGGEGSSPVAMRELHEPGTMQFDLFVTCDAPRDYYLLQRDVALLLATEANITSLSEVKVNDAGIDYDLQQIVNLFGAPVVQSATAPLLVVPSMGTAA